LLGEIEPRKIIRT
jgi:hypothetical protein